MHSTASILVTPYLAYYTTIIASDIQTALNFLENPGVANGGVLYYNNRNSRSTLTHT